MFSGEIQPSANRPHDGEHPRLLGSEPELDGLRGHRSGAVTADGVELAVQSYDAPGQGRAQEPQGFLGECHHVLSASRRSAHRGDGIGDAAPADTELDPSVGEHAQRRGGLGEHHRRTQLQVGHVGEEGDAVGGRGQMRDQGPGVEVAGLVGVVLDGEVVQARVLRRPREAPDLRPGPGGGIEAHSEGEWASVVGHASTVRRTAPPAKRWVRC